MTDLLLTDARLPGRPDPTDLLVVDGRVATLGGPRRTDVETLDLDGRWLIPGLWDHHVHFAQWAIMRRRMDLSGATSAQAAAQAVAARMAAEMEMHEPVIGYGYRDAMWEDEACAEVLDAVAPRRPVVLLSGDMHACWVNTAARDRYGLPEAGVLREDDAFALQMRLEKAAPGDEDLAVSDAAVAAAARGVVGIVDLEMARNLDGWTERMSRGLHALRVHSGFYPAELEERVAAGWRTGDVVPGTGDLLSIGPLKIITDGSLNTRTAYCHDPYPGRDTRGVLTVAPEECETLLERATAQGFSVAVHAIGDAAVTHALDAFERTGAQGTLEHAQLVSEKDLPRFGQLGVTASVQPEHLWDDRDPTERIWPDRAHRAFPLGALRDAGARLVLGSDAPVAPLDPWRGIAAAVHRSGDERAPWYPEHALTREQAIAGAASHATLTEGALADLVALDADPLECGIDDLQRMPVAATMVAGRLTHLAM
ncbi:amidohydrolase [Demequina activiva]|uniref:Amidohydrolase n=1 Tax=Demequina activiva TaxID=1582364 RepID=A0A919Q449_9MICO|nr:amidohydrolase family protein [Demequina activiva]GIG54561.1 amidohydrolase [Demequina activiva]